MAKMISTKTHGVLDYLTVGQLLALPRMLGWRKGVTQWMSGMALGTLAYSLITRYEVGPIKLLPMQGHLALDFLSGLTFCAAPLIFPKEDTTVQATLVGIGLFEIVASLSTETQPSYGEQASEFMQDTTNNIGDAVQSMTDTPNERTVGA